MLYEFVLVLVFASISNLMRKTRFRKFSNGNLKHSVKMVGFAK
jgi:hypothetical protein